MIKQKVVAALMLALVSASTGALAQNQRNPYTQVLQYSLEVVNSKKIMSGLIDRNTFGDSTKQAMRGVVANIDLSELAVKMTPGYERKVTASQIASCVHFTKSPIGQKLLAAVKNGSFPKNAQAFTNSMSNEDISSFNAYMSGPCVFSNLPDSREMHEAFDIFMHEQTCSNLLKTNPDAYSKLQQANYCKRRSS